MKTLLEQIKEVFLLGSGRVLTIEEKGNKSFLSHPLHELIVAIPFEQEIEVYEEFNGFVVETTTISVNGENCKGLGLKANDSIDINKYAQIAADFLSPENRSSILKKPFEWIDGWKTIFGDSINNKMIYDVIGEMIVLKHLFKEDKTVVWQGQLGGTHDIVGEKSIAEVKTTKVKKNSTIEINSSYQLSIEKPTNLFFVHLEEKPYCLTINKLAKELIDLGYDSNQLEKCLNKAGYKKGSRKRDQSFDLLSIKSFFISKEEFPIFGLKEINEFAPKKNIISYNIGLDLSANTCTTIYEKE